MRSELGAAEAIRLAYAHNLAALGEGGEALRHFGRTCEPFFCSDWTGHVLSPRIAALAGETHNYCWHLIWVAFFSRCEQ